MGFGQQLADYQSDPLPTAPTPPLLVILPVLFVSLCWIYFVVSRYRAIYAYKPQNEDELEMLENDEVYVMEKCDDGWYVGTSGRTGMFGTFPGNYVTRIQ